jgi:hypothetical protein
MNGFSIREAIKFGGQKARENAAFLILAFLTWIGIAVVEHWVEKIPNLHWPLQIASTLVINPLLTMGLNRCILDILDGEKPRIPRLFSQGNLLLNYWGMFLITLLILGCLAGLLFAGALGLGLTAIFNPDFLHNWKVLVLLGLGLVAACILLAARLCFVQWALVDLSCGPIECYRHSLRISKGHGLKLILFALSLIVLNVIGLICLLVGVFVTVAITVVAVAHVYRLLLKQAEPSAA